jgi:hypothetical protein
MSSGPPILACGEIWPVSPFEQRWRDGYHSWKRRSDGGFNASRYLVEEISFTTAREYVVQHHYAHSYPADSRRFGLFLDDPEEGIALVGVAVFGIPAQPKVLLSAFPGLSPVEQSLELSRFVLEGAPRPAGLDAAAGVARGAGVGLVDRAPANSETWFLARAMSSLAATGVRGVISFADPVPRRVNGELVFGGHCGTIYAAHNAVFAGRSTTRTLTILPDGSSLNARSAHPVSGGDN